jgi:hypothetical protein
VSGTVLTGYTFHGPFTTIDAASSWLAACLPRKLGVCTDAIVLLEPPEPTELTADIRAGAVAAVYSQKLREWQEETGHSHPSVAAEGGE